MKGQDSNAIMKIQRGCPGCQVRQLACDLVLWPPSTLSNQVACQGPVQFGPQQCGRTLGQQSGQCMATSSGRNVPLYLVSTHVCVRSHVYRCAEGAEVNLSRVFRLLWKQGLLLNQ